eukprot:CAMPEP_0168453698 /NCGR_PEP_ID=MMETSP0228-20121227/49825_1 /TAXON_ID=133427 /ORGANISM="Protoceratium reticulatum, Strain CCCM 535 (=CCMP 1889)" /LENGTH=135 /DNA_ID=CAMNT_0008468433 /DNA_START=77 /DNA_END=482 /DNA_ORIENTATION=+
MSSFSCVMPHHKSADRQWPPDQHPATWTKLVASMLKILGVTMATTRPSDFVVVEAKLAAAQRLRLPVHPRGQRQHHGHRSTTAEVTGCGGARVRLVPSAEGAGSGHRGRGDLHRAQARGARHRAAAQAQRPVMER